MDPTILVAPLAVVISELISPFQRNLAPRARPGPGLFISVAVILTLILVLSGIYLTFKGGAGDIEISGLGITVKTQTGGIALIALGLIFYLAIGRLLTKDD